jgi:hypothetical protein
MTRGLNRRMVRISARLNVAELPAASVEDLLSLGLVDITRLSDAQLEEIARSGPLDMSSLTDVQLHQIAAGEPPDVVVPSRRRSL